MTVLARLLLTCGGGLVGGYLAGMCVSFFQYATSKGVPFIGAVFIGIVVGSVYCVLALIACLGGNIAWLALRPWAAAYEQFALPLLIAAIDFMMLNEAVRSTDFFEPGGRWFPAGVLLVVLIFAMYANSRNSSNV